MLFFGFLRGVGRGRVGGWSHDGVLAREDDKQEEGKFKMLLDKLRLLHRAAQALLTLTIVGFFSCGVGGAVVIIDFSVFRRKGLR